MRNLFEKPIEVLARSITPLDDALTDAVTEGIDRHGVVRINNVLKQRTTEALLHDEQFADPAPEVPRWSRAARVPDGEGDLGPDLREGWLLEEGRGWPVLTLAWRADFNPRIDGPGEVTAVRGGISLTPPPHSTDSPVLPLTPIWSGLIAATPTGSCPRKAPGSSCWSG